jgi:hypothetical protein
MKVYKLKREYYEEKLKETNTIGCVVILAILKRVQTNGVNLI